MRKGSWVTIGAVLAAVTALACGSGDSSGTAAAPPPTVALGTAISLKDGAAEVAVVVTAVDQKAVSNNQFDKPKRGQFVAVTVEVTAAKGASDIGPSNFRLIGNDGNVVKAEILVAGIDPQLDAMTEIQQGQKKSGKVVFDCDPAKVAGGKIEISNDGGDPVGYWTF